MFGLNWNNAKKGGNYYKTFSNMGSEKNSFKSITKRKFMHHIFCLVVFKQFRSWET